MEGNGYNLNFMYKKIDVPRPVMVSWFKLPEFTNAIQNKIDLGISINNQVVYDIIKKIYFEKLQMKSNGQNIGDFNYYGMKRGIQKLCKILFDESNYWKHEYEKFLENNMIL